MVVCSLALMSRPILQSRPALLLEFRSSARRGCAQLAMCCERSLSIRPAQLLTVLAIRFPSIVFRDRSSTSATLQVVVAVEDAAGHAEPIAQRAAARLTIPTWFRAVRQRKFPSNQPPRFGKHRQSTKSSVAI